MNTLPQKQLKVVLIGDNCIDEYHYGTVSRLSPEAPVPILSNPKIVKKPGMAANVKANLEALGVEVKFYTRSPSVKIRMLDDKTNHHLLRIDYDNDEAVNTPISIDEIDLTDADAVIISDYDKGVVDTNIGKHIRNKFSGPIFVDTKKTFYGCFPGSIIKVNSLEANLAKWNYSTIKNLEKFIVTDGPNSVTAYQFVNKLLSPIKIYPVKQVKAFDVCGAGDTFLAALAYGHLTLDEEEAINFAIKASSITIQYIGVYAPTLEEINNVI